MTGLDITKRWLTISPASCALASMKQNGGPAIQESTDKARSLIQSSKVSFSELSHPPPIQGHGRDDEN